VTGSAVLGTAIGLGLVFGLLALFASAVTEAVSSFTERRAHYLITGLRSMLDQEESASGNTLLTTEGTKSQLAKLVKEPKETEDIRVRMETDPAGARPGDLTAALFGHPLIKSQQTRRVSLIFGGRIRNPSYLDPQVFARAMVDTLVPAVNPDGTPAPVPDNMVLALQTAALKLPADFPARRTMVMLAQQASGDMAKLESSLADWYDQQMSRISGWYKRWVKVVLIVVGLAVAVLINIDAVQVGRELYVDGPVREAVVAQALSGSLCKDEADGTAAKQCADQQIAALGSKGLPIGYAKACSWPLRNAACWATTPGSPVDWTDVVMKILGWLLTAFATSFGAPFWFDALSKLGNLRTSGPKPA